MTLGKDSWKEDPSRALFAPSLSRSALFRKRQRSTSAWPRRMAAESDVWERMLHEEKLDDMAMECSLPMPGSSFHGMSETAPAHVRARIPGPARAPDAEFLQQRKRRLDDTHDADDVLTSPRASVDDDRCA